MFLYKNPNNGELFLDSNGGYRGGDYEDRFLTQKVIGEFVCDEIYVRPANVIYYGKGQEDYLDLLKCACMTEREVLDYMGGQFNRETYFWHISDLKIYDKPRELGEFGNYKTEWVQWYHSDDKVFYPLKRMSGSWCYIDEE